MSSGIDGDRYLFTRGWREIIPEELRSKEIGAVYLEYFSVCPDGTPLEVQNRFQNHVTLKIDLTSPFHKVKSVRIDMTPDYGAESLGSKGGRTHLPGQLFIRSLEYTGASRSTARTYQIHFARGIILEWLLLVIEKNNLQYFSFAIINNDYSGCRDFIGFRNSAAIGANAEPFKLGSSVNPEVLASSVAARG
ncbi:hypothetical protein GGR55DRAFT_675205 [Xylaria sp. FL0064]|nr:hypothetical protein GGR55DRAFT_675205 [Xylaria sp. FL0064]